MIYTKINGQETPLTALQMFCKCPECGAKVRMSPGMVEEIAADAGENFSFDDIATYCDDCHEKMEDFRGHLENITEYLEKQPLNEMSFGQLKKLYDMADPLCVGIFGYSLTRDLFEDDQESNEQA